MGRKLALHLLSTYQRFKHLSLVIYYCINHPTTKIYLCTPVEESELSLLINTPTYQLGAKAGSRKAYPSVCGPDAHSTNNAELKVDPLCAWLHLGALSHLFPPLHCRGQGDLHINRAHAVLCFTHGKQEKENVQRTKRQNSTYFPTFAWSQADSNE